MTVTYWREHSNPELSSESALATFNPIIKLAPTLPLSLRKIDGEGEWMNENEKEREIVCVCVCVKRDFSPYHNPDTVPTPNRFDEGNRAVRNLHSQISFSSDVFAPLIRIISTCYSLRVTCDSLFRRSPNGGRHTPVSIIPWLRLH